MKFTSLEWRSFKWNRKLIWILTNMTDRAPLTSHICTGLLYHSEGTWSRFILLLCSHRGMCSNTTGAFNMLWKWDISITIIWLRSRRLQMFSKNSGLISANQLHLDGDRFLCTPAGFAGKNKLSLGSKFVWKCNTL